MLAGFREEPAGGSYRFLNNDGNGWCECGRCRALDPAGEAVEGDASFRDLASLPEPVSAAVLEVPKDETAEWVRRVADAGITSLWIHQQTDTPEALQLAEERGLQVCSGTCAVMYVTPGVSPHMVHRWVMKLAKKY